MITPRAICRGGDLGAAPAIAARTLRVHVPTLVLDTGSPAGAGGGRRIASEAPRWRRPGDPDLYRAIAFVWELARRTNPRHFSPGVYRYRSIDEMNRADDARLDAHTARLAHARTDLAALPKRR